MEPSGTLSICNIGHRCVIMTKGEGGFGLTFEGDDQVFVQAGMQAKINHLNLAPQANSALQHEERIMGMDSKAVSIDSCLHA
ncbi:hypothetical protein D918_01289 [Trichuris suis]|nr:hypothetical protein D918_01289 [Trichuris suis]